MRISNSWNFSLLKKIQTFFRTRNHEIAWKVIGYINEVFVLLLICTQKTQLLFG